MKIDKNIPIPIVFRGKWNGPTTASTFRKMKKGDSIFLKLSRFTVNNYGAAYLGRGKFVVRAEGKGFRIWKTK